MKYLQIDKKAPEQPQNRPVVIKVIIEHLEDPDGDVSYLKSTIDAAGKIDSCQYDQEELDKHPRLTRRYIKEDTERLESYGRDWYMLGIRAKAEVHYRIGTSDNFRIEHFTSGGLWGIESDSSPEEFKETEQEQLAELKAHLEVFGIDTTNFESKIERS